MGIVQGRQQALDGAPHHLLAIHGPAVERLLDEVPGLPESVHLVAEVIRGVVVSRLRRPGGAGTGRAGRRTQWQHPETERIAPSHQVAGKERGDEQHRRRSRDDGRRRQTRAVHGGWKFHIPDRAAPRATDGTPPGHRNTVVAAAATEPIFRLGLALCMEGNANHVTHATPGRGPTRTRRRHRRRAGQGPGRRGRHQLHPLRRALAGARQTPPERLPRLRHAAGPDLSAGRPRQPPAPAAAEPGGRGRPPDSRRRGRSRRAAPPGPGPVAARLPVRAPARTTSAGSSGGCAAHPRSAPRSGRAARWSTRSSRCTRSPAPAPPGHRTSPSA